MSFMSDRVAYRVFLASVVLLAFGWGAVAGRYRIFPFQVLSLAVKGYKQLVALRSPKDTEFVFARAKDAHPATVYNTPQACEGVNLITRMAAGGVITASVTDLDGKCLHEWTLDWFKIWPDANHVPSQQLPKERPGAMIDGAVLLENGNLIFNFDYLGLVCVDFDANVVWRLPYVTHHSVTRADDGNLWVCGQRLQTKPAAQVSSVRMPFTEDTLLEVTPDGKIKREWSIIDLLTKNGRQGLVYMGTKSGTPTVSGGSFHLNDVEPFPARLKEGFFKKGDVLVSLRNINTVFVFNQNDDKIKFLRTGSFVWQHDPDFIDGDRFSILDNHPLDNCQSRILVVSASKKTVTTYYEGTPEHPFSTKIMGKHQWLPNGNLLITEAQRGRIFEVDPKGTIVWEYNNDVSEKQVGLVTEAMRLPISFALLFRNSQLHAKAMLEESTIAQLQCKGLQR
jgi:hypothetical protein